MLSYVIKTIIIRLYKLVVYLAPLYKIYLCILEHKDGKKHKGIGSQYDNLVQRL